MFAKNLEIALFSLCEKSDVSHSPPQEFAARFDALRRYGKLPRGRERRDQLLTSSEIAAAILGLAPGNSNWAGHAAVILSDLRPIGGMDASFFGTSTLQESISYILTDATARNSIIRLTVSVAERGINSHGYATLSYLIDGIGRRTFYGRNEAVSLMQPGAEKDFDPGEPYSPVSRETAFDRTFFQRLAREMQRSKASRCRPQEMAQNTTLKKPRRSGTENLVYAEVHGF
jgi:hypothetical protein